MKRIKVIISENGIVSVPDKVVMQDFEIAELFDVLIPTVRTNNRAILKLRVVTVDTGLSGTILGNTLYPDYYGLDMVVTLAFRIQSRQAEIFRRWVLNKATIKGKSVTPQIFVSVGSRVNKELN